MGSDGRVYLDYNASAPLKPGVKAAVVAALDLVGNPSSVHGHGRAVRRAVEDARAKVAALAGAAPTRAVFTAGGTEANNLALRGFPGRRPIVSAVEHDSVLAAVPDAPRIPVDSQGRADLDALERLLAGGGPALVSLMLVNNETGVIQPVAEAARIAHAHGALLHCDAVQAAGRLPLALADLGADLLTLSAHKIGGPAGVGALLLGEGVEPEPLLRGGGQERRRRAGTENLLGIVGFGAAAALAAEDVAAAPDRAALRDSLEMRALDAVPVARVMGAGAARVGTVSCLALPGASGETQVMALDLAGIAVSAGSACSSGKVKASHVLRAMGADDSLAGSALRISLGWGSTAEDVGRFLAAWIAMARRLGLAQ
ncbi:cysteine desulfurase family protein [Azospirillum sp. TSO22-1]|uniref:cysteine desulfurase family protein n=1 Tax=Azospirillum sp. TSO22-1 TaxID=716789 RepID=UPI000D61C39A|nr:cysteine desulfurase family protein [Azospirillum sp. TSO22-1]PWC54624.1 cysteine desulfurase [Azospirillum sp. TSO22-1]